MKTLTLTELQEALDWVSADFADGEAFIELATGTIYYFLDGEPDEYVPEPSGDVHDEAHYLAVPHKRTFDLGSQLVFRFALDHMGDQYDDVRDIFRQRGAYRRFKDLLVRTGQLDAWHAYEQAGTVKALRAWCEENGLAVE